MDGKVSLLKSLVSLSFTLLLVLLVFLFLISCVGCSIIEVKQDHYKRDFGKIPKKEIITIEDAGAVSVGATELNKGLNWIYYGGVEKENSRVKILLEFSYNVMGFLGVAWDSIDWDNPDEWFKQADEKQKAMEQALRNEKDRNLKLEKESQDLLQNLANNTKIIKDKDAEMQDRDGKWSAKFSWWIKILVWIIGLILFLGLAYWIYTSAIKCIAGLPMKIAFFGGKTVAKGMKQVVAGIQEARLKIKDNIKNGGTEEEKHCMKKALDILHRSLDTAGNEEVHNLVNSIKNKHNMKRAE